jgi:hypothetical protein
MTKTIYVSDIPADVALNPLRNYNKLLVVHVPAAELLTANVYAAHVAHDDWCKIYRHGNCNCKPEIAIEHLATHKIVIILK